MRSFTGDVVPRGTASPEALPRLEAASRQNFHCLGLGLGLEPCCLGLDKSASVLLLPRGTNQAEANFSSTLYGITT